MSAWDYLKLWPVIVGLVALLVAVVKLVYQVQRSLEWQQSVAPRFAAVEHAVEHLKDVPERLKDLEKKMDRLTPRVREVQRLRTDLDALDDDVSEVREAMIARRQPGRRTPRSRTPPGGVPIAVPEETTDVNDDSGGSKP